MELSLVVAILRIRALDATERKLSEIGVRGITVIKARGFGEHALHHDILGHVLTKDQAKLEIYVASDQAERVAASIIEVAHTARRAMGSWRSCPSKGFSACALALTPYRTVYASQTLR